MADLLLAFGSLGADLALTDIALTDLAGAKDLAIDDGLLSAVVVSLFSDRLANGGDELPAGEADRRGWWADATLPGGKDRIGSRLWLLRREKQLPEVVARARDYALEALQWLVDEERVESLEVFASVAGPGHLHITVQLRLPRGAGGWQQTFGYRPDTNRFDLA